MIAGMESTVGDCVEGNAEPIVIPTLGRDDGGLLRFLTSAAQAFVSGVGVDWRALLPEAGFVELPTYAFERRRFWLAGDGTGADAAGLGLGAGSTRCWARWWSYRTPAGWC
ncbi:putative polyketide synthase type I [Mycobacterium xenopi 4042]|uniref:Putative polyketide synthase type I n=1 Tax=Mycobacterium xenopi 4042 TaxID=1299334 RepID=X8BGP8_MYCXE|nr:putative polyketide synthase type I [Mycobacterium xenopi 4042]